MPMLLMRRHGQDAHATPLFADGGEGLKSLLRWEGKGLEVEGGICYDAVYAGLEDAGIRSDQGCGG